MEADAPADVSVSSGTAVFAWTQKDTATTFKVRFMRARLPATGAPVALTDPSPLVATSTVTDENAWTVETAGTNALYTVWGDNRWGASQLYDVATTLQNCK